MLAISHPVTVTRSSHSIDNCHIGSAGNRLNDSRLNA